LQHPSSFPLVSVSIKHLFGFWLVQLYSNKRIIYLRLCIYISLYLYFSVSSNSWFYFIFLSITPKLCVQWKCCTNIILDYKHSEVTVVTSIVLDCLKIGIKMLNRFCFGEVGGNEKEKLSHGWKLKWETLY